ncbi:MAG TPA: thiamine diphosphokinase [Cerasibacillus sp.]|uniref:thiamine diphosphokinase n=1 Tax=Cerasibacillus sp. TaxID=2498711 RepID=UPI002F3F0F84
MNIAIVANGPLKNIPPLSDYRKEVDIWIGADRGALTLIKHGISPKIAIGDFDSISDDEIEQIKNLANKVKIYPIEKDKTDLELAIDLAIAYNPKNIYLFGVTGGRLDHTIVNIQLLLTLLEHDIKGIIIDKQNILRITYPGKYSVSFHSAYPHISFLPLTKEITGLTLHGFYYPLKNQTVSFGSSLCISNKLTENKGTFSYETGILLVIKSRDS